ncbi:gliding motility-associated protein GldE [Porphyromonas gingivicanis]|uniref:gliding motility-associated protein GldE n=1 Tax=Porphyromonas gingivicanis TaxID=266762 RepID=UPI00068AB8BF|nr:gliding motility-associated protein GldE [Porphyromonas gingivicanis]
MDTIVSSFLTSLFPLYFPEIQVLPFTFGAAIALLLIVVLLVLSGYMSSSEVAFFSLSPQNIHEVRNSNTPTDQKLLTLLSESEKLLATILIGNNIVNISIVLLSNYWVRLTFDFGEAESMRFIVQTIALTFILLLFGEIIPKVYAQNNPLAFSRFSTKIMYPLHRLLSPLSKLLIKISSSLDKKTSKQYSLSVDDLSKAVELTIDQTEEESKLIGEIIKFHAKTANEIMLPRVDMVSVDYSWTFTEVLAFILEAGYSRIPVFQGTQDDIKGILYIKDCIPYAQETDEFNWHRLIREAYFVPENKKIDDLLEEFRSQRIHISIVVDEYGGTSGLITLEDILEEIVGEITDEYDEEELLYTRLPDGSLLFEGKTPINDFCRLLDIDPKVFEEISQEVDTLSGIYLEVKQELPRVGAFAEYAGFRFEITKLEKYRIMQMRITLPKEYTDNPQ